MDTTLLLGILFITIVQKAILCEINYKYYLPYNFYVFNSIGFFSQSILRLYEEFYSIKCFSLDKNSVGIFGVIYLNNLNDIIDNKLSLKNIFEIYIPVYHNTSEINYFDIIDFKLNSMDNLHERFFYLLRQSKISTFHNVEIDYNYYKII